MDPNRQRKLRSRRGNGPPEGEPWVWLTRQMLESDAWRALGINARRFVEFLLIEHMTHAGTENGNLLAPYSQLVRFGLPRSEISLAISDAVSFGFVGQARGQRLAGKVGASRYSISWLPTKDGAPATNAWKRISAVATHQIKERRSKGLQLKRERQRAIRK